MLTNTHFQTHKISSTSKALTLLTVNGIKLAMGTVLCFLDKTLTKLGVCNGDMLHLVRKYNNFHLYIYT